MNNNKKCEVSTCTKRATASYYNVWLGKEVAVCDEDYTFMNLRTAHVQAVYQGVGAAA